MSNDFLDNYNGAIASLQENRKKYLKSNTS